MPASMFTLTNLSRLGPALVAMLGKWTDGKYYQVIKITQCDFDKRTAKCVFEDLAEFWLPAADLHLQLDIEQMATDLTVCAFCDDDSSKSPNEIIICDSCHQGFHVDCHQPKIDRDQDNLDDPEAEWICATCKFLAVQAATINKKTSGHRIISRSTSLSSGYVTPTKQSRTPKKSKVSKSERKNPKVKLATPRGEPNASSTETKDSRPNRRTKKVNFGTNDTIEQQNEPEKETIEAEKVSNVEPNEEVTKLDSEPLNSSSDTTIETQQPDQPTAQDDSSEDEPETLPNGAIIEKVPPEIAAVATIIAKSDDVMDTEDLVGMLTPDQFHDSTNNNNNNLTETVKVKGLRKKALKPKKKEELANKKKEAANGLVKDPVAA